MIASYRDPNYAASVRLEALHERIGQQMEAIPSELRKLYCRRLARSWAGAVGIIGFVAMVLTGILEPIVSRDHSASTFRPTYCLVGAAGLALVTYIVARVVAGGLFSKRVLSRVDTSGDALSWVARIESEAVRYVARELVSAEEKRGIALPMMGISLLTPLFLHLVVWALIGPSRSLSSWLNDFDTWIRASLVLVGIAHLTLAVLCYRYAGRMSQMSFEELGWKTSRSGWGTYGWTVLASCVPGLIAFAIPVLITAATGLLFIPLMFSVVHSTAIGERRALEEAF